MSRRRSKALGAGTEIDDIDVFCAAADDDPEVLLALLEAGGNPSAADDTGSCLMKAFNSRSQVDRKVELLLEHGADVNGYDDPTYYGLLACCLAHGMISAPTDRETLRQFKAWSETDHFHQSVARAKAGWAKQFVALVNNATNQAWLRQTV